MRSPRRFVNGHRVNAVARLTLGLLLVCIMSSWCACVVSAAETQYFYLLFESSAVVPPQEDGKSGVGVMCRPGTDIAVPTMDTVYLSDMCGSGSTIRRVNWSGIRTIAGSSTSTGYVDGDSTTARFGGLAQGSTLANGLCYSESLLFLADTGNNVIRSIVPETGLTSTYISRDSKLEGLALNFPNSVAPYRHLTGSKSTDLFISDTSNKRILFAPLEFTVVPPLTMAKSGFQPGLITVASDLQTLFYISGMDHVNGLNLETNVAWSIGRTSCTGYISSLHLSADSTQILYYAEKSGVKGVYGLPTSPSSTVANDCGTLLFEWPYSETIRAIAVRNDYSYYIVTDTKVYITTNREVYFPPSDALDNRTHGTIGFPIAALPVGDDCLMSGFYEKMMEDIAAAFGTKDYYIQFAPTDDRAFLVNGTVNVSEWCALLSAYDTNKDGSVVTIDVYGPPGLGSEGMSDALGNASWGNVTDYLDTLHKHGQGPSGPDGEQYPFCLVCQGDACADVVIEGMDYCPHAGSSTTTTTTTTTTTAAPTTASSTCDRFCIAGIVCATTMGVTLIALIILAILSPSNIFNAVFMVPII